MYKRQEFDDAFAVIVQLPNKNGQLKYCDALLRVAEVYKCVKISIVDPMCQVLMQPVGEWGFDIAVGSLQRFGIPRDTEVLMLHSLQLQTNIRERYLAEL